VGGRRGRDVRKGDGVSRTLDLKTPLYSRRYYAETTRFSSQQTNLQHEAEGLLSGRRRRQHIVRPMCLACAGWIVNSKQEMSADEYFKQSTRRTNFFM